MENYVAIDIGASSGRVMLLNNPQTFELTEIHRFKNGAKYQNGILSWDIEQLIAEILTGLEKVKAAGIEACYIGIDTWAVDYCLVDQNGQLRGKAISYRDERTKASMANVLEKIEKEQLYRKTGIQFQPFNTIFQLAVENRIQPEDQILLIPDYIAYVLTGEKVLEATNASTMQLINLETGELDEDLLKLIGIKKEQFPPIVAAGTKIGQLLPKEGRSLPNATVIAVGTHDTASAVVGVPADSLNWAFLSSGTWSLLGREIDQPIATTEAQKENYTNEAGVLGRTRFLKNITGLWLVQEISRLHPEYSFAQLANFAQKEAPFMFYIDVLDPSFVAPENMCEAIDAYCQKSGQSTPQTIGQYVRCIYENLALCYGQEFLQLEKLTQTEIQCLHIVGGGSNIDFLNQLTANSIQKEVIAGPTEATALGNIIMQMLAIQKIETLEDARKQLRKTLELKRYQPQESLNCYQIKQHTILNNYNKT